MPRAIAVGYLAVALSFGAGVDAQTQLDMTRDARRALRNAENMLEVALNIYRKRLDESRRAACICARDAPTGGRSSRPSERHRRRLRGTIV